MGFHTCGLGRGLPLVGNGIWDILVCMLVTARARSSPFAVGLMAPDSAARDSSLVIHPSYGRSPRSRYPPVCQCLNKSQRMKPSPFRWTTYRSKVPVKDTGQLQRGLSKWRERKTCPTCSFPEGYAKQLFSMLEGFSGVTSTGPPPRARTGTSVTRWHRTREIHKLCHLG